MFRAFWSFIKISLLIAAIVWLSELEGHVEIAIGENIIQMHLGVFGLISLGALLLGILIYSGLNAISNIPKYFSKHNKLRSHLKGYRAITLGLTSVAAGDAKIAAYQAFRARKFMPENDGLSLLLDAQAAKMQGRLGDAMKSYEALSHNKDAAFIGLRGRLQNAIDAKDQVRAMKLAREALDIYPKIPWILQMVYDLEIHERNWQAARRILDRLEKAKGIDHDKALSDRVAMLVAEADAATESDDYALARKKLRLAVRLVPYFVPAYERMIQNDVRQGHETRALSTLKKAWKASPHPSYLPLWDALISDKLKGDPLGDLRWAERLLKLDSDSHDAHLYMAQKAMDHRLWGEARGSLDKAERLNPSARLYRQKALLASLTNHEKEASAYMERAASMPLSKTWVCEQSGLTYDRWKPMAMPHGSFNTIIWDHPQSVVSDFPSIGNDQDDGAILPGSPKSLKSA